MLNSLSKVVLEMVQKRKKQLFFFLPVLAIFLFLVIYVLPVNIHGDGFTHAYIAESIAKNGWPIDHIPHSIVYLTEQGERIYSPIHYPETAHGFMALFYKVAGESGLKWYTIVFGCITGYAVFFILRRLDSGLAASAAILSVILNAKRFVLTPILEPFLLASFFLSLAFIIEYFYTKKTRFLILGGVTLGFFLATKHASLYIFPILFLSLFLVIVFQKASRKKALLSLFTLLIISLSISFYPIYNQLDRVGTLGYGLGQTKIPSFIPFHNVIQDKLFNSSVLIDGDVLEESDSILSYRLRETSFYGTLERYILFPVGYESERIEYSYFWLVTFGCFVIFGAYFFWKKDKYIFATIIGTFLIEFITTYYYRQRVFQYHVVGVAMLVILITFGIRQFVVFIKYLPYQKIIITSLMVIFSATIVIAYAQYLHPSIWKNEGRRTDAEVEAYKQMGDFVKSNTNKDAIIMASGLQLAKYGERDVVWHGAQAYEIFEADTEAEALEILNKRPAVKYLLINTDQYNRAGVYDFLPSDGIAAAIDANSKFTRLHEVEYLKNDESESLVLYLINSEPLQ